MPESTSKRHRGSYSKLICLRCRSRKIRCILPDEVTIQPSGTPQPAGKECKRCRQKDLECIIDHTTLGRPSSKRPRADIILEADHLDIFPQRAPSEASSADVGDFLVTPTPEAGHVPGCHRRKPSNLEVVDALSSPHRHFSSLISRDRGFASLFPSLSPTTMRKSVLELVSPELANILDQCLVWHKLYYPYIPELPLLRSQCASTNSLHNKPTLLLFALLCSIALDIPAQHLTSHRRLQPALRNAIFHYGQDILFGVPKDPHALVALELIVAYQPLALVSSQSAAALAIRGTLYFTLIKHIALQLYMDTAASTLRELLDTGSETNLEQMLMDTLQWCNITKLEVQQETIVHSLQQSAYLSSSIEFTLETLKLALERGYMPRKAYFLFHRLASFTQKIQGINTILKNWRSLDTPADVITKHEVRCVQEREEVNTALQTLFADQDPAEAEQAFVISQLCEAEIQARHTDIVGISMFYGVMSGAVQQQQQQQHPSTTTTTNASTNHDHDQTPQQLDPAEVLRISDHIITRLQATTDPLRIRRFLEEFGSTRMDDLERTLTNFINNCSLSLSLPPVPPSSSSPSRPAHPSTSIPFVGPTRHLASCILFRCKDVVENNAARLKGWGTLHERVDTQLVLLLESARRLEAMDVQCADAAAAAEQQKGGGGEGEGGETDAVARGSLCAASARLIRSLHRIVSGWRRGVVEAERRKKRQVGSAAEAGMLPAAAAVVEEEAAGEGRSAGISGEVEDTAGRAMGEEAVTGGLDDLLDGGDLFADWSNWPQMDAFDFTTLSTEDFSWEHV